VTDTPPRPFLRTPAIDPDGRRVAFVYAGDIWLAEVAGGPAERLTAHQAYHISPRFSPDGAQLAFTSGRTGNGEIYVLPLDGGPVRQVTFHEASCTVEDWAPDGAALYFTSAREQLGTDIYRVDLDGSTPALIYAEPYESLDHVRVSPDGTQLAFSNTRDRWWRSGPNPFAPGEIWVGPATPDYGALRLVAGPGQPNGHPALVAPYAGRNSWPLWARDGAGLFFVSDRDGVENLWYQPLDGGEPRQLTRFADGRLLFPAVARRSGLVVFERDARLWRLDPAGGEPEPIDVRVRGDTKYTPVRIESWSRNFSELRLSPDGRKVAFVARGTIFADFADKETDRDLRHGPAFRVAESFARESQVAWTPDSRRLVYVSDRHGEDELFCYDFAARAETRLTDDLTPKRLPRVSPDGRWVAYISADEAVRLVSLAGEPGRELCRARFVHSADLCWSPDSRWLAFMANDERAFSNVWVVPAEGGEPHQITFLSNVDGGGLLWAPGGQFIVFTTQQYRAEAQIVRVDLRPAQPVFRESEFERLFEERREREEREERTPPQRVEVEVAPAEPPREPEAGEPGDGPAAAEQERPAEGQPAGEPAPAPQQPAPPAILFEGVERRLRFLTPMQMDASAEAISPDGKDLLFLAFVAGKVNIWSLPLDEPRAEQPFRQLTASEGVKTHLQFTPDGKAFFYLEDGQIVSRKFPGGDGYLRLAARGELTVDFHREKLQIFGEAWRALRDSFYDPTFRGQDWAAVRERFAPLAAGATTPAELHTAINLMVGELRASHLGSGGNGWAGADGYTGILFDQGELLAGRLRVERVIPESPASLAANPPRPGEYLRAVDGAALGPGISLDRLLRRTAGRRVRLTLAARPDGGDTREIDLRPVDAGEYTHLRYRDWVLGNKRYVARVGEGRLGYVHIEQMSYGAYQQFLADLDAETHGKDGVIVDVRYNSGGHTAPFILDVLTRRSTVLSGFRGDRGVDAGHIAGSRVLNKPTVLVTNERSASNTEMLSESYRRLGLGKVVGRPTAGAVIWTISMRLLDGATLRLPRFYVVTPEGEELEGRGRPVDVEAHRPLGEWALGRDRQLDAAAAALRADAE
jgi:tricorn protease